MSFDAAHLNKQLGGTLVGPSVSVTSLAPNNAPVTASIVVATDLKEAARLAESDAAVLVVPHDYEYDNAHNDKGARQHTLIKVDNPRLALATLSQIFDTQPPVAEGISSAAYLHPSADIAENVHIAPGVFIAKGARIGPGTRIGANCVIGEGVVIGDSCILHPRVTLYSGATLGKRVILHSGVVIGADGFGYAASAQGAVKIHHLGRVILEDDVEIGANACIDRGTLSETRIGARSKIDNLCQIGHNVRVGTDCFIAGMVGIGGSTTLGNRVIVGGSAGFADHLSIGDDARIAGRAGVTKSVPGGETWAGFPAQPYKKWVRGLYLLGKLETLWQAFRGKSS